MKYLCDVINKVSKKSSCCLLQMIFHVITCWPLADIQVDFVRQSKGPA